MKEQTEKFKATLLRLAIFTATSVGAFLVIGIFISENFKGLGQWGDFVGGTLNPILGSAISKRRFSRCWKCMPAFKQHELW